MVAPSSLSSSFDLDEDENYQSAEDDWDALRITRSKTAHLKLPLQSPLVESSDEIESSRAQRVIQQLLVHSKKQRSVKTVITERLTSVNAVTLYV